MNKKILVADDDQAILEALSMILEDEGYAVVTTSDGETIYGLLDQKPDLLLLDIWMSGMDGRDICKKLKSDNKTKSIPIILFSANKDTERIAKEAGADNFISKPFEIEELLSKLEKHTSS